MDHFHPARSTAGRGGDRLFHQVPPAGAAPGARLARTGAADDQPARDVHRNRAWASDHFGQGRFRFRLQCARDLRRAARPDGRVPASTALETQPIREQLRSYVAAVIASTWPDEKPPADIRYPDVSHMPLTGESSVLGAIINDVGREIHRLEPKDPLQQSLLTTCLQQYSGLVTSRWTVIEGARGSITMPFFWVLVLWLVILFASLGLTAPANPVTTIVIALSAISITVAMFVIIDLDLPYGGLFGIPSTPMREALADMIRP